MTQTTEKIPPQALEAEQAVLGAMLLSREAIDSVVQIIKPKQFYGPAHRKIYQVILDLYDSNEPVDLITATHELGNRKQLEGIGGRAYLASLTEATPGIANIEHHAKIVLEKATLSGLIEAANKILTDVFDQTRETEEILDTAEHTIMSIKDQTLVGTSHSIGDILPAATNYIDRLSQGLVVGLPSGLKPLDDMTFGFQKSDMIIAACRPSVGKTAFAVNNVVCHVSIDCGLPVVIFSLEMSKEQLAVRLLCSHARVNPKTIRNNRQFSPEMATRITQSAAVFNQAPIFIDDTPSANILDIRAKSRRMKAKENIQLIVIDYLQLVTGPKNAETRQQEVSCISRGIKSIARELEVPVLALSQLSRQVELRGKDAKPQLSDLRESGSLEQDSDVVLFIHRDRDDDGNYGNDAEINLAKHRNGPTGKVKLSFVKDYARFELREDFHKYFPNYN